MKFNIYLIRLLLFLPFMMQAQVDRSSIPQPGPPPEIHLREPLTFSLNSGLKVLVVPDNKLPRVSMQLTLDNPPVLEGEKAGVSALTASLLGNGSKNIPKDEFNEEVDFLGASISFGAQSASARTLSKYFPRILELMAEATIYPNFTEEDFETEKARLITAVQSQEKDVVAIGERLQEALAYGTGHPYGEFMTEESINRVSLVDIEEFYRNYFVPANAYLVVIGDVEPQQVQEMVTRFFTPWTKASPPSFSYTRPSSAPFTQINLVDMPNAVQSEISVQHLVDFQMNDADYLPALLANRIFGGGFQSRLNQNIREDKGYAYYAYSRLADDKYAPGTFKAVTSVRNSVTDSAVVQILMELDSIILPTITAEELSDVKAEYTGSFVMALEKPETVARYALNIETENLPEDFYTTYLERLNAVTVEEVQQAAVKYLKPVGRRIVISGKLSEILPGLQAIRYNGNGIPIRFYNKLAQQVEKPEAFVKLPDGVTLESVLSAYFNAVGGKPALENVNTLKLVYEGKAMGSDIKIVELRGQERFSQTTYMNGSPMMGVVAKGDDWFMKQGANKMPLPELMKKDMKNFLAVFPEVKILSNPAAKVTGIEEVDGNQAYRIDIPGEAVQVSYFYDMESGLKLKEQTLITFNGQSQQQETFFKDYKTYEGLLLPSVRLSSMGQEQLESTLTEVGVNEEFSESDFE